MVKNKEFEEFEYCSWNQNEWGWNFQNVWIRPLICIFKAFESLLHFKVEKLNRGGILQRKNIKWG
jgi:hypothetical protein